MPKYIRFAGHSINVDHIVSMYKYKNNDYGLDTINEKILRDSDPTNNYKLFYSDSLEDGKNSYCAKDDNDTENEEQNKKSIKKIKKQMNKKIKKLEDKIEELENQIKFLPMVSTEYKKAEEHFASLQNN